MQLTIFEFSAETFTIATLQEAIASHDSFDYFSFITVTWNKMYDGLTIWMISNEVSLVYITIPLGQYALTFSGIQMEVAFIL